MAQSYDRRINLYINIDGKQVKNNVKDISAEMRRLVNGQKQMTIGSEEYLREAKKIQFLKGIIDQHYQDVNKISKSWSFKGMAEGFNKYVGVVATGVAAVAGFIYKMNQAVQASDNFNDKLANLSAITGLAGAELEWLGNKAKELSTSTLEGGINITKSADDIVEAFTKMGSARPDLLKNKDALAEVTKQALILSEAGKIDLDTAIQSVAASMNQFNLEGADSARIINAVAAGSLEGSAEIADLTESMKNVGTVANDSNMTLEQSIAALEVLAEKQLKGAEAGTKLRGALLKMKDAGVGYASGQFNLRDALEEVNGKLATQGSELERDALKAKIFGIENITAGSILLQNVEKYDALTAAVTGTNVAYQQAAKNTNTDIALKKQAINEYHRAAIELGQNLSPAVTALYRGLGSLTRSFSEMIAVPVSDKLREEQAEVNNLVKSIVSVNDNQKIRNGLIQELQQKYPDFIGNIDAEKVSNDDLLKKLDEVNKAYLERIKIAVNQEDITENEKKMRDVWKEQRELVKDIDSQYERLVTNKKANATLDEKIAAIAKTSSAVQGYGSVTYASNAGIANLQKERLLILTQKENELSAEYNNLLKERETINPDPKKDSDPEIGTRKTVGNEVMEWDGKIWKIVQTLNPSGGGNKDTLKTDPFAPEPEEEIDMGWILASVDADDKAFAEKKRSQDEWTAYLDKKVQEQIDIKNKELEFDKEVAAAQQELKAVRIDAIGQVAGALSDMFEQGSAAQIAFLAIEKASAIAQVIFQTAIANAKAKALAFGNPLLWAPMVAANNISAAASIAAIVAQSISQVVQTSKSKKQQGATGRAIGGFMQGEQTYTVSEAGPEWIAPNWMLKHPITGSILANMEMWRNNPVMLTQGAIQANSRTNSSSGSYAPQFATSAASSSGNFAEESGVSNQQLVKMNTLLEKLLGWKPTLYTEQVKKDLDDLENIEQNRGL